MWGVELKIAKMLMFYIGGEPAATVATLNEREAEGRER